MMMIRQKYVFFGKKLLIPYQMLLCGLCGHCKNTLVIYQRVIYGLGSKSETFHCRNRSRELQQSHAGISIACVITVIKNSSFKKLLPNHGLSLRL